MSNYYGYNAKTPDLSGIERAGKTIGDAIGQIPENVRNKKADEASQAALQKAADMANKDWGSMETSAKAIKGTYQKKAKALIEQGLYTKEQLDEDMQLLPIPLNAHKKDVLGYMKTLGTNYNTLLDKLDKISSKQQTGADVKKAVEGSPAGMEAVGEKKFIEQEPGQGFTEQDIQQTEAIPPAPDQETAAKRIPESIGMKQAEDVPAFATLPTQDDLAKQTEADRKSKFEQKKLDDLNKYRNRMLAKGHKEDVVKDSVKKLEYLDKRRDKAFDQDLKLNKEKTSLVTLTKKIEKGDELSLDELENIGFLGLDVGDVRANSEEVIKIISKQIDDVEDKIHAHKKEAGKIKNARRELLEDPEADVFDVLKEGEESAFQDQPELKFGAPPVLGGGGRIGIGSGLPTESIGGPKPSSPRSQSALTWAQAQLAKNPQDPVALKVLAKAKRELGQ